MQAILTTVAAAAGLIGTPAVIAVAVSAFTVRLSKEAITEKVKAAIKAEYDEKLERLKAELKVSNDVELERQKHQLALQAQRFSLQFSRLQDRRAGVIAEVYSALTETISALRQYVAIFEHAGMGTRQERYETLVEAHKKFQGVFTPNKIFLPKGVEARIDGLNREIFDSGNKFAISVDRSGGERGDTDKWMEVWTRVGDPMSEALTELEGEFRRLMGDEPEEP
ncbi:hypothetical protein BH10PSE3_BH10PSE3_07080 [soil metagenome]